MTQFRIWCSLLLIGTASVAAPLHIPGTGTPVPAAKATFDDVDWAFDYKPPKSQSDDGGPSNGPGGEGNKGYTGLDTNYHARIVEDTYRGYPEIVERTTSPVVAGAGALRLATQFQGKSAYDALSWQHIFAVSPIRHMPVSRTPSALVRVHVPDPATWPPTRFRPFLLMGMVSGPTGPWWPYMSAGPDEDNPGHYSWYITTGAGTTNDPFVTHDYLTDPAVEISTQGWWTVGSSIQDNALHWFVREGLVNPGKADHIGAYRSGMITNVFGMPGGTIWMDSLDGTNMSPSWVVDELEFFYGPPATPTVLIVK